MSRKSHPGERAVALLADGLSWDEIAKKLRMPRKRAYNFWHGYTHREERKQWYRDNQEAHKAVCATYRAENRDIILAKKRIVGRMETEARQKYQDNLVKQAAYRDANREKLRASYREIYRRDIDASRLRHRIRNSNRRHGDEWGPVHRASLDLKTICRELEDGKG